MFHRYIALAAIGVAAVLVPQVSKASSPLSEFKIQEILINPQGGNDETQGREFITLRGPANTSLNGYAIVVVENENSGGDDDGRGKIDNIFPLDGYVSDSNGYFVIRDSVDNQPSTTRNYSGVNYSLGSLGSTSGSTGHDPFTGQAWPNRNGTASEMILDFESLYSISLPARGLESSGTLNFGGNSLENGGGNYFLVKNINPGLVQQINNSGGTKQSNGTTLDSHPSTSNGTFDFFNGSGSTRPWDTTVDGVYVGEGSDETGYETSLDYVTNSDAETKAVYQASASPWSYNGSDGTSLAGSAWNHTPDYVVRLSNSSGVSLTHTATDASSNTVTIDDMLGTELDTPSGSTDSFKTGSGNAELWDTTGITFSSTIYASPTFAFSFTHSGVTYYHP